MSAHGCWRCENTECECEAPVITPEIAAELAAEGERLSRAFMERTKSMVVRPDECRRCDRKDATIAALIEERDAAWESRDAEVAAKLRVVAAVRAEADATIATLRAALRGAVAEIERINRGWEMVEVDHDQLLAWTKLADTEGT